jgi:toxin ParE1/3/4
MIGFALHPEAYDDIDEIRAYIAEDNPDAADRMVNEIFDRIRQLISFPDQGFRRPNLTSLPLRFVTVRNYVIAYAPRKTHCGLWLSFMAAATHA